MSLPWRSASGILSWCGLAFWLASAAWAGDKAAAPSTQRWAEGQPGCTFSADDDGKYRYGLWTDDFGITLAVDSQELEKAVRRTLPLFNVRLTAHYRGTGSLLLKPGNVSLEFVKHYHDLQPALDPQELSARFQQDAAQFAEQTDREIRKHPEKQVEKMSALEDHQKDVSQMLEFLKTRSLTEAKLDIANRDADGWVFFNARSKWVGDWKKQEEFVLRIPLPDRIIEFPFALPPSPKDLILRRRP
jgi:hypothetical protein